MYNRAFLFFRFLSVRRTLDAIQVDVVPTPEDVLYAHAMLATRGLHDLHSTEPRVPVHIPLRSRRVTRDPLRSARRIARRRTDR